MSTRTIRGRVAVVGVGESPYYKHGQSPDSEFVLALRAVFAAAQDAGINPKEIDGFASFSNDRNTGVRLANALGVNELRWSSMQWGGGGGGASGAVQQAAAAVAAGFADTVVVYRSLAQGQFGRFGATMPRKPTDSLRVPYGMTTPATVYASRMMRFFHETGVSPDVQKAVSLASYRHAQNNPRAVMHGRPLDELTYDESRWIVEPWRLFDLCQENDGAAALIVTSAERARDLISTPAFILAAAQGGGYRSGGFLENVYDTPDFVTSDYKEVARRLWAMAEMTPADVDVVQSYENFTGAVVLSLIEHGFCTIDDVEEVLTIDNLSAPTGKLPLNTSGGNLAEAYIHGLGSHVEAVRQLRGESNNQVPGARVSFASSGPMVTPASSVLFGTEEVL